MTILLNTTLLLFITVVLVNEFYQMKLGVPCTPTLPRVRDKMLELADAPAGGKIVSLGSGWGGMSRGAARRYPQSAVLGVESSLFPYIFSRLRPHPANLTFTRGDFFKAPLGDAAVVLCYLTNPLMAKLKEKLLRELPDGAKVVSSTFFIPGWEPEFTADVDGAWKTRIFVYRKRA